MCSQLVMLILYNKIQYHRADYYNTREIRNNRILCPVIKDTFYIIFLRRAQNKVQLLFYRHLED